MCNECWEPELAKPCHKEIGNHRVAKTVKLPKPPTLTPEIIKELIEEGEENAREIERRTRHMEILNDKGIWIR